MLLVVCGILFAAMFVLLIVSMYVMSPARLKHSERAIYDHSVPSKKRRVSRPGGHP